MDPLDSFGPALEESCGPARPTGIIKQPAIQPLLPASLSLFSFLAGHVRLPKLSRPASQPASLNLPDPLTGWPGITHSQGIRKMVGDGKKTTYYYHQLLPATGQPELVRGACGRGHLSDLHVPRTGSDGLETTQSSAITVSLPPTTAAAAIRCRCQLL